MPQWPNWYKIGHYFTLELLNLLVEIRGVPVIREDEDFA